MQGNIKRAILSHQVLLVSSLKPLKQTPRGSLLEEPREGLRKLPGFNSERRSYWRKMQNNRHWQWKIVFDEYRRGRSDLNIYFGPYTAGNTWDFRIRCCGLCLDAVRTVFVVCSCIADERSHSNESPFSQALSS